MTNLVRANTLKAGQLIQTTKGRIYVLIQMVSSYGGLHIEVAECGKKKIDTVRELIDANAMVTPVEADFFIGGECVHRTYNEEDDDEMVAMPAKGNGTPIVIRRCVECKKTLPLAADKTAAYITRCKACARQNKKRSKQRNRKPPGSIRNA